jgi:hypothetical protein
MPARGAKPKPPGHAVTRHKALDWTEVPDAPFTGGPPLRQYRRNGKPWPEACKRKWDAWRSMPHAAIWTPSDWEFAFDSIEIAATMMGGFDTEPDPRAATELRNREKVMGTTADYRRDIRVRYVPADDAEGPAPLTVLDDYRDL